jgi:hypothetical protein
MRCRDRVPTGCPNRLASPRPVPTAPPPLSEATSPSVFEARRCLAVSAVTRFVHGERRPSPPLTVFRSWSVELTSHSLLPVVGPPPATVAPPRQKNATAKPVFSPSPSTRSSGELFSPSPCPAGSLTAVGALPRRLRHLRRCGVTAGHTVMRARRAVTAPACAAPSRAAQAEAGPASAGRALRTRATPVS